MRTVTCMLAAVALCTLAPAAQSGVSTAEQISLFARPTVLRWSQGATLYGSVGSGRANEEVTLQARDCGLSSFTGVAAVLTHEGGTWTTQFNRGIGSTVRAVWKGEMSAPVTLRQIPDLNLYRRGPGRFEVGITSKGQFWRKRVLFQRRAPGGWKTVKQVVLTESGGQRGVPFVWTSAEFRAKVSKGSLVRVALPASQARPCYLPTVSDTVRA